MFEVSLLFGVWCFSNGGKSYPNPRAKSGLELLGQGLGGGLALDDGKGGRAAAGHQSGGGGLGAQKLLEEREQRKLLEGRRFEAIVKLRAGRGQIAGPKQFDQTLRSPLPAMERIRKTGELLVRPGGGDAKTRMDQQKHGAAQRRESFEGVDLFTASDGQRRFVL